MGSSPFTATIRTMDILYALDAFFRNEVPLDSGDTLIAAFSGGSDSTALLLGLTQLAKRRNCGVVAAHLDHAMDAGSASRAQEAAHLAAHLGVPFVSERREVARSRESAEAAARRVRYRFLEEVRARFGARWIVTAHHRDDQAETVLLRLRFGSGLEGLRGIHPVRDTVVRPLLGVARRDLLATLGDLVPVHDPTNDDTKMPRNRMRHSLLPRLEAASLLAQVATRASSACARIERRLGQILSLETRPDGVAVERAVLEQLPVELVPFALAWLHRQAGAPYPAGRAARGELLRQLGQRSEDGRAGCDSGAGWRWETSDKLLILRRTTLRSEPATNFSYTLEAPGEVEIPEIAVRVGLCRRPVEPWMLSGSPRCAALTLPAGREGWVTVRNRRPGDRVHPLGASGSRKLKALLIDRRVPKNERDRLPLVCVGEQIAWIPGVTIDERFRIAGESIAWTVWLTEVKT